METISPTDRTLLCKTICAGMPSEEVDRFLHFCDSIGADPLRGDVVPQARNSKQRDGSWKTTYAYVTTIDHMRSMAEATSAYRGQTPVEWCGLDGKWVDVWLKTEHPAAARVGVYRENWPAPLYAVALWDAYVQKTQQGEPTRMWGTMGPFMLGKCAESLSLRKAFPRILGKLYTRDEMAQADNPAPKGVSDTLARAVDANMADVPEARKAPPKQRQPKPSPASEPEEPPPPTDEPEAEPVREVVQAAARAEAVRNDGEGIMFDVPPMPEEGGDYEGDPEVDPNTLPNEELPVNKDTQRHYSLNEFKGACIRVRKMLAGKNVDVANLPTDVSGFTGPQLKAQWNELWKRWYASPEGKARQASKRAG